MHRSRGEKIKKKESQGCTEAKRLGQSKPQQSCSGEKKKLSELLQLNSAEASRKKKTKLTMHAEPDLSRSLGRKKTEIDIPNLKL
jgi:hypothetical protein